MDTSTGLRDLAELLTPDTPIESVSRPEPAIADFNVVAIYDRETDARAAVLSLEDIEDDGSSLGLVNFGRPDSDGRRDVDGRIATTTLSRAGSGAIVGALVGAAIIGFAAALFSTGGVLTGAALGGALFGAFLGGLWAAFARFGGSSAFRQSFSADPSMPTLVSLHTDDPERAQAAQQLLTPGAIVGPDVVRSIDGRLQVEPH